MKNSLWGYNKHEVDEMIDSLRAKNDALSSRLNLLKSQLNDKEAELERKNLETVSEAQAIENAERLKALEEENLSLKDSLKSLRIQNEEFLKRLAEMSEKHDSGNEIKGRELEEISEMFRDAYSDIANVKRQAADEINGYVNGFQAQLIQARESITSAMEGITQANERARLSFIDTAEEMLELYERVNLNSDQVNDYLSDADDIGRLLSEKIENLLSNKNERKIVSSVLKEPEKEDSLPSRLKSARSERHADNVRVTESGIVHEAAPGRSSSSFEVYSSRAAQDNINNSRSHEGYEKTSVNNAILDSKAANSKISITHANENAPNSKDNAYNDNNVSSEKNENVKEDDENKVIIGFKTNLDPRKIF